MTAVDIAGTPRVRLEVRPSALVPARPVALERLLGVADLTAPNLLDQPPALVACCRLAEKAALGRLRAVAAAEHEPLPDATRRLVRVDAGAAPVAGRLRRAVAGGDLPQSFVEAQRRLLQAEATRSPPAARVAPADLPAGAVPSHAHGPPGPVRWTHEHHSTVLGAQRRKRKNPRYAGLFRSRGAAGNGGPYRDRLLSMRMRGLEPPQSYLHTDLNRIEGVSLRPGASDASKLRGSRGRVGRGGRYGCCHDVVTPGCAHKATTRSRHCSCSGQRSR